AEVVRLCRQHAAGRVEPLLAARPALVRVRGASLECARNIDLSHPGARAACRPGGGASARAGDALRQRERRVAYSRARRRHREGVIQVLYCRVPWLRCVDVRGADAYDFLRRQLTNDPPAADDRFALAAWNDAKGRV